MASRFQEQSHFESNSPPGSVHGAQEISSGPSLDAAERDDASTTDHVQDKAPLATPLTKRQKVKRHCGRFKWWYLGCNIIFLAILLPLLFLVILPAIVQRIVDNQSMPINGGAFMVLSPTELQVSLKTSLNTPLPARIDPISLFLFNKETSTYSPFLNLTLPEQHVNGDTPIIITNQTVSFTNETELVYWFNEVFDQPKVSLSTRGDTTVHLGALHSNVHLEKTVEVSSLNSLSGFGIQDLRLILPAEPGGKNVKGTLNLPNWGALTLGLGNITFNLWSGDVRIGLITIYDVVIPPGNNTKTFDGQLFLNDLIGNLGKVLESQSEALNEGKIQIDASGNSTIVNGQPIPFINAILNKKRVTSYVSVIKLLSDVINSLAGGGNMSLPDLLSEVFGNSTLIEQALDHWKANMNGTATAPKLGQLTARRSALPLQLIKLGMKMGLAKH